MKSSIKLNNMEFYAYHGVHDFEMNVGTKYIVSVSMDVNFSKAGKSDKLEDTIDYSLIYRIIKDEMNIRSNLIEHLAYKILSRLKKEFPLADSFSLSIKKCNPPLNGEVESAEVSISD